MLQKIVFFQTRLKLLRKCPEICLKKKSETVINTFKDIVKVTDVPIGSYGIFPKADLSEIYIKSWNNNGTTNIITFKPDTSQPMAEQNPIDVILERINQLESKIDNVIKIPETTPQS